MALVVKDRVRETSTTTGTGTLTLAGAVTGFQTFSSAIGNTNTTYYTITNGSEWEVGIGTVAAGTLARTTVLSSSNAGSAVTFSAGTKDVFCTYPAGKALYTDATGNAIGLGTVAATTTLTNATGLPISTGVSGLGTSVATALGTAVGSAGAVVVNGGVLGTPSSGTLTNCTFPTLNQNTSGSAASLSATLVATSGGTGQSTYAVGDLLQGGATNTLTKLAAVATGNALISGGVGVASSYGKIGLTTHVSGTLPIANGGTNSTATPTAGGAAYGTGTANAYTTAGTSGQPLISAGASAPAFGTLALGTANTNVSGALTVTNGGTGAATLTGVIKGTGTTAMVAATAGTDFVAPATATTFTATQTFNGSTSVLAAVFANAAETTTVSATAATGTIQYDVTTQSVLYYTTSASANFTVNFRASSGTSLNTAMATGQTVTVVFLCTNGATAYYNNAITVDGTSVTPKYQGGTAFTSGNASGIDAYSYTIIKTGSAAFTILISQTQFK